jgi:hypothetical protein
MGNATVRLKAPKLVQVMTSIVAWSSVLIDPTGQCTAHPIIYAATCRGEGMTGSPPGPAHPSRAPGPDERTARPRSHP